ncbi:hypothetical protein L1987_75467 [Smallanthus sonchifolius]|uniref:Uncharacterized protein n=1 Tax=Smallanthus sonchifolius TaxID=185202 RepID=A0ACB9A617_9ASTR|nr:hypothetical protein L1987_75467 [Smallanthus sonchifolius]
MIRANMSSCKSKDLLNRDLGREGDVACSTARNTAPSYVVSRHGGDEQYVYAYMHSMYNLPSSIHRCSPSSLNIAAQSSAATRRRSGGCSGV